MRPGTWVTSTRTLPALTRSQPKIREVCLLICRSSACAEYTLSPIMSKVGKRLEERGMVVLLQPGLTRAALNDYRLGHILDALFAANLNRVFSALALQALEVYAIPTPWLHQDTTTLVLYGAYEDA